MTILSISTDRRSAYAGGATGLIAGPPGNPGTPGGPGSAGPPGPGVPAGGGSGYFLRKQSSADYDTVWAALGLPVGGIVGTTDAQALTHKDITDASNTFPTFNQNTTGSAAKWTAARLLAGNAADGSGDVSFANKFIAQGTSDSGLSGAQFLGALGTGLVKNTTSTGVLSIAVASDIAALVGGAATPLMDGAASVGTSSLLAREDHAHPSDTSRLALTGGTMTGALTLAADPTSSLHAATKQYVDAVAQGLSVKPSVLCATTGNITVSGEQTLDGVTTSASRVLVKNQSIASQNGIYVSGSGAWTRAAESNTWAEQAGSFVFVESGTLYGQTGWFNSSAVSGTLGTTSVNWTQFSGAGTYTAGSGLTLTGSQFSIASGTITNAMLAGSIAASKLVGSDIASVGTVTSGVWNGTAIDATHGGNGQTSWTLGDLLYSSAANTLAKLAGNTTATKKYLSQTGNGTISGAPAWAQIAAADISGLAASATTDATNLDNITGGTSFTSFTPTVVASSGPITTLGTVTGRYRKVGKICFYALDITITSAGSATGYVKVTNMPYTCGPDYNFGAGQELASVFKAEIVTVDPGTTTLTITFADGTNSVASGYHLTASGWYETL